MSTYSVQFGAMQDANTGLMSVHQKLTSMVDDLNHQVQNNTVDFQGNTRDLFFQAHQEYNAHHDELTNALNQANSALANIHETYTGAEQRGAALWG